MNAAVNFYARAATRGELGADVVGWARAGFEASPWSFGAALAFTMVQCCCVLFLVDISSGTRDLLPWSCMPLYCLPRSLHDALPKFFCCSSADLREPGFLDPFFHHPGSVFTFSEDDMKKLPDRRLFFGSSDGPIPPEIRALANPAMLGLPFVHAANFEPSPELLDEAKGLIDALRSGEGIDALLARHEEVMREFRLDAVYDHED